ncbi:hypothetical protein PC39_11512 [Salinisphaera sp. PC39]|uniref:hypothetical protein n=1 Tax=Salinisphaera sp. PC39 TaxID=1304156 RepID=UPI00333F5757
MRTLLLTALLAGAAPAASAAGDCRETLARIESASRSAQEALLVARARGDAPRIAKQLATLEASVAEAGANCGELAARDPEDVKGRETKDFMPEFSAADKESAQKGGKRLDRSKRGY